MIEYLAANMWQVWAVVSIVCLILELSSGDFFIICFSIGAVFGAVAAAVGMSIYWQLALFARRYSLCSLSSAYSLYDPLLCVTYTRMKIIG